MHRIALVLPLALLLLPAGRAERLQGTVPVAQQGGELRGEAEGEIRLGHPFLPGGLRGRLFTEDGTQYGLLVTRFPADGVLAGRGRTLDGGGPVVGEWSLDGEFAATLELDGLVVELEGEFEGREWAGEWRAEPVAPEGEEEEEEGEGLQGRGGGRTARR